MGAAAVALLGDGQLDTLALGQGDPGLLGTDDEDVGLAGGEGVVNGVLDVDDVETTIVALTVGDDADTTHVTATGGHGDGAGVELDEVGDLAGGEVDLDGVVDLDGRVRVADAARGGKLAYCREGGHIQPLNEAPILCRDGWNRSGQGARHPMKGNAGALPRSGRAAGRLREGGVPAYCHRPAGKLPLESTKA